MYYVGNNQKRKFVTLMGSEVCATAWWRIHGIPKSTFHTYMDRYKRGIVTGTHEMTILNVPDYSQCKLWALLLQLLMSAQIKCRIKCTELNQIG